ncbi:hypothetical protein PN497_05485, partial [Sphaerospermopsis kisseleviana CS-549]
FFNYFWAIAKRCCKQFAIDRKLIAKSLKRRIFVHAHHGEFVQCVSPNYETLVGWAYFDKLSTSLAHQSCTSLQRKVL